MDELRQCRLTERWVLVAPSRADRPIQLHAPLGSSPADSRCPFCAGNEADTPPALQQFPGSAAPKPMDSSGSGAWRVRVVPNKFPAVRLDAPPPAACEPYLAQPASGVHEVIVQSGQHKTRGVQLNAEESRWTWEAYYDRLRAAESTPGVVHAQVFQNVGMAAGASLEHIHSQLIATSVVPSGVQQRLRIAEQHYRSRQDCLLCEMVRDELSLEERIVFCTDELVAFCPYAARFPYETWLVPRAHQSQFHQVTRSFCETLAGALRHLLRCLEDCAAEAAYNLLLHAPPFDRIRYDHYHWHTELLPRLTLMAGFEWATDACINPLPPESAARQLRLASQAIRSADGGTYSVWKS